MGKRTYLRRLPCGGAVSSPHLQAAAHAVGGLHHVDVVRHDERDGVVGRREDAHRAAHPVAGEPDVARRLRHLGRGAAFPWRRGNSASAFSGAATNCRTKMDARQWRIQRQGGVFLPTYKGKVWLFAYLSCGHLGAIAGGENLLCPSPVSAHAEFFCTASF